MHPVLEQISNIGVVPVIAINDVEKAVPLAQALRRGGIPCAEVTFRTAEGEEAIRRIAQAEPDVLVGAGTVTTIDQVDRAIAAGAKFVVSPGFNPKIVQYCIEKDMPITPGCSSPTDIEQALSFGLEVVKFFPAEQAGGLPFIKAVSAPYTSVRFMPTGGINAKNITEYLAFDKIIACGGSWMVKPELINEGRFDEITDLCTAAMQSVLGFKLSHIGINGENEAEAMLQAQQFHKLFSFAVSPGNSSIFAGDCIEVMKTPFLGKNGHIAFGTNSVSRAMHYLQNRGFAFREDTIKKDAKGKIKAIYLKEEIGGFAIHLVQN